MQRSLNTCDRRSVDLRIVLRYPIKCRGRRLCHFLCKYNRPGSESNYFFFNFRRNRSIRRKAKGEHKLFLGYLNVTMKKRRHCGMQ